MFTEVFPRCETPDGLKQAFKKHPTVFKYREKVLFFTKGCGTTPPPSYVGMWMERFINYYKS